MKHVAIYAVGDAANTEDEQRTAGGILAEVGVRGDGDEEVEVAAVVSTAAAVRKGGGRGGIGARTAPAAYLRLAVAGNTRGGGGDEYEDGDVAVGALELRHQ